MAENKQVNGRKPVRIWVDGCFDMMHYGHSNALRQAKAMGDVLIVGVHSDAEILLHKGPTVMKEKERYEAVRACKWVDEVVEDAPYFTTVEMLDKYNCDFCVHGDDVTTLADGTDCYQEVKEAGRYKECKRTQGVSTTELVGRMLLMSKEHLQRRPLVITSPTSPATEESVREFGQRTVVSQFLPTSKRILQFSNAREPSASDRVIYVDGGFDLFHIGHIEFLKKAKAQGDFLVVGIHDDATVNKVKGSNFPIMNLHERVLSVLSCRYVDEVIIGAPYSVTQDVLSKVYPISLVIHGTTPIDSDITGEDPYELPKKLGIYKEIESPMPDLSTEAIVRRILEHRLQYEARNRRKAGKAEVEKAMEEEEKKKKNPAH